MKTIYGIGNPLIDMLCSITESDITALGLHKGTMQLIDAERHAELVAYLHGKEITYSPGGSCPNTMVTLASLGIDTTIAGGVGNDELATIYREKLKEGGVHDDLAGYDAATGTSIILLTEDKERTMNTYLGANRLFDSTKLNIEAIKSKDIFYFTGYMWDTENQKNAIRKVLEIAKERKMIIAFDLADPFAVGRYRQTFYTLIKDYCDIVFANSEEARFLFDNYDAYECCRSMGKLCPIAIVKNGKKGSFISDSRKMLHIDVLGSSTPVDTTGAGDTYAAGFLYGVAKGYSTKDSGEIASYLAGEIISTLGAQFSPAKTKELQEYLESHYHKA